MKITKPKQKKTYIAGFCAVCITIVYLVGAWITAHNVVCTRYSLDTSKDIGAGIKIAYLADSHVGTTFDGVGFEKQLDKIKKGYTIYLTNEENEKNKLIDFNLTAEEFNNIILETNNLYL